MSSIFEKGSYEPSSLGLLPANLPEQIPKPIRL